MLNSLAARRQSWRHAGGVFALAAAALAVGIGATTAIYTVVNAVMLRPIAYAHGERFGQLFGASIGERQRPFLPQLPGRVAYQTETQSFDAFGWFRPETYTLTSPGSRSTCRARRSRPRWPRTWACSRPSAAGSPNRRRGHLEQAVASARRRARDYRFGNRLERTALHRDRRDAATIPAAGDRPRRQQRPQRRLDPARRRRERSGIPRRQLLLRLRAAQARRFVRARRTPTSSGWPPTSRAAIPRRILATRPVSTRCRRWWSAASGRRC